MERYIDADKLTKVIEGTYLDGDSSYSYHATGEGDTLIGKFQVIDIISDQPTADVEEVRHGEWVDHIVDASQNIKSIDKDTCSVCRKRFYQIAETGCVWRFCPNCGARMDGGK